ncbi:hypothetical protein JCM10296v2_004739 [Rhodotorula toruloides]
MLTLFLSSPLPSVFSLASPPPSTCLFLHRSTSSSFPRHRSTRPSKWACAKQSDWFSLCKPILDNRGCTNDEYSQCGGIGFKGEKQGRHDLQEGLGLVERLRSRQAYFQAALVHLEADDDRALDHQAALHRKPHSPSTTKPHHPTPPPRASVTSKLDELRLSPDWNVNAPPQKREYWWEVAEHHGALDGCDTVVVHVTNSLDEPVTIHWHGLFQNGTLWEDGPSGVTQCPIGPGITYTYDSPITGKEQYGTFWWHAHRRALYIDGITGLFVIHSKNDPLKRGRDFDIDQIRHTLWHQIQGLLGTLIIEPDVIRTPQIPQDNLALCNGGNASVMDPGRKRSLARPALPAAPAFTGGFVKAN